MWNVRVFGENGWREALAIEVSGPPTIDALLQASRQGLPTESRLLDHLGGELSAGSVTDDRFGRQPISVWARLAEEESREFEWSTGTRVTALDGEVLGLSWSERNTAAPSVLAWHDPTAIIIRLGAEDREIQIEYVSDDAADDHAAQLRYRYGTARHALETILDWRGYFGTQTAVIDGSNVMRTNGRGFITRLRGRAGYVVGRLLRRLTFDNPTLDRDPLALFRERRAARQYPAVASACPALSERNDVTSPHAMIFVHGTASCGLQGLKDVFFVPAEAPTYPIRRFEHDTFRPIGENADELVRLIKASARVDELLLVAHSRGGLVARLAVDSLIREGYAASVSVATFGSPHAGTPLAKVGGRLLSQLYKIGEWGVNIAVPVLSPLTWAHGFLFDAPVLPPGIAVMAEDSEALGLMNRFGDPSIVDCWGSEFDSDGPGSGFGIEVEGLLRGAMYDVKNDLVVPTSSSVAFGSPASRLACSHVQYFLQPQVQSALRDYFIPPVTAFTPGLSTQASTSTISPDPGSRAEANLRQLRRKKPPRLT